MMNFRSSRRRGNSVSRRARGCMWAVLMDLGRGWLILRIFCRCIIIKWSRVRVTRNSKRPFYFTIAMGKYKIGKVIPTTPFISLHPSKWRSPRMWIFIIPDKEGRSRSIMSKSRRRNLCMNLRIISNLSSGRWISEGVNSWDLNLYKWWKSTNKQRWIPLSKRRSTEKSMRWRCLFWDTCFPKRNRKNVNMK